MVPRPSLPQYYSCERPVCWDYASCIKEFPLGGKVVRQNMDSQYKEGHQVGNNMLLLTQHEKARECRNSWLAFAN
jgi:hypothetical protein